MRVEIKADFDEALRANIDLPQKVVVVIDCLIPKNLVPVPENTIVFWVTTQPEGDYNQIIKDHPECYTYLLTFFPDLLELPNSWYFMGCTPFVDPTSDIKKSFGISTVMSGRMNLPGHKLRREFFDRQYEVLPPLDFYLGTHNALPDELYKSGIRLSPEKRDKIRVFDRMFHVTFASYRMEDFFSEKLIDCFLTMTVPIFWGCPNINEFFNIDGIIEVEDVDEAIDACNSLRTVDYGRRAKALIDNYERALEYRTYEYTLERTIKRMLYENP